MISTMISTFLINIKFILNLQIIYIYNQKLCVFFRKANSLYTFSFDYKFITNSVKTRFLSKISSFLAKIIQKIQSNVNIYILCLKTKF